jgi:hypothetical protein
MAETGRTGDAEIAGIRWYLSRAQISARRRIAELDSLAATMESVAGNGCGAANARRMLAHARHELDRRLGLTGILRRHEADALQSVDAAELELLWEASDEDLTAALPTVTERARAELAPSDSRRQRLEAFLAHAAGVHAGLRDAVTTATSAANIRRRRALVRMSHLTRLVAGAAAAAAGLAAVLAVLGTFRPGVLSLCFSAPAGPVCPAGGVPRGTDILLIEVCGLLGAVASTLLTARPLRDVALPTPLALLAAALKLPLGALLAVAGMLLIARGLVPGLTALDTGRQIVGWSLLFGAGQQVLTAPIDRRLVDLGRRTSRWYDSVLRGKTKLPSHALYRTIRQPHVPRRHRYRLVCLLVTLLGTTAAFLPMGLALQSWTPSIAGTGAALLMAWQGVRRSPQHRVLRHPVRVLVRVVGRAAACASAVALVVLVVDYAGIVAVDAVDALTGRDLAGQVAMISAATVAAALSLIVAAEVQADVGQSLLGGTAQPAPVLIPRLQGDRARRTMLIATAALGGLMAAATVAHAPVSATAWAGAGVLVAVNVFVVLRRSARSGALASSREPGDDFREDLRQLLEVDGWNVMSDPQVGSPDVDSLLERIDLVVRQREQALALQIHTAGPDEQLTDWRAASELLVATNALARFFQHRAIDIEAVMVLVDSAPDGSLRKLAQSRSVHLVEVGHKTGRVPEQVRDKLARLRGAAPAPQG